MNLPTFKRSLTEPAPPDGLTPALRGLWLDGKDDWDGAHAAVQPDESEEAAWVHAYLHRKEGDLDNARYWYRRARKDETRVPLDEEWSAIAEALLVRAGPGPHAGADAHSGK